jgi:hypothetical protein
MTDPSCEAFQATVAELALGVADGRERSELLAHAAHCAECRHELLALGEAADRLLDLIPPAEPPAGFESRILASVRSATGPSGSAQPSADPGPAEERPSTALAARTTAKTVWYGRAPLRSAAAVAAALALVAGGWLARSATDTKSAGQGSALASAVLERGHSRVGRVIVTTGAHPWVAVAVGVPVGDRTVVCKLRLRNGAKVNVGTFAMTGDYGYWATTIPATASPVTGAEIDTPTGQVLAEGTLSAS